MKRLHLVPNRAQDKAKVCCVAGTVRIFDYLGAIEADYFEAFEDGGDLLIILKDKPTDYTKRILKNKNRNQFFIGQKALKNLDAYTGDYDYWTNENSIRVRVR